MRVVDARGEARLVEEHLDELFLAGEVRVQALDGDEALEAADAAEPGEEHRRHAAGRDLADQLVAVEPPLRVGRVEQSDLRHRAPPLRTRPTAPSTAPRSRMQRGRRGRRAAASSGRRLFHWVKTASTTVTAAAPAVAPMRTLVRVCLARPCW